MALSDAIGDNLENIMQSRADVLAIVLIQRREAVIDAHEEYKRRLVSNSSAPSRIIVPQIQSLFIALRANLKRDVKKERYDAIRESVESGDVERCMQAFYEMDDYLDNKNLTRLDTRISMRNMGAMGRNKVMQ